MNREGTMNALSFTGERAQREQAITETQDIAVRRRAVLEALSLRTGERVLELGCGGGYLAREAAKFVGATGQVSAVDISPDQIVAAQARCADLAWVECRIADIAALPYADGAFNAVIAVQSLEYLPDLDAGLRQIHRVLRPGGRLIVVATDWSSAVWHSENVARMQRVLTAWAPHTPSRHLPTLLAATPSPAPPTP